MAYIIPNAGDTGGGQRYSNTNQAEPDSLDIEALGLRNNWIRSGGEISVAGGQFSVTSGVAVVAGTPYTFSALGATSVTSATNARFDLVIVRVTGGSAAIVILEGTDSSSNPVLPRSKSVLPTGSYNSTYHVNPDTDVLLGAIYVTASPITDASVVEKRIIDVRPLTRTVASLPTDSDADLPGDVSIYNGVVYVKVDGSTWKEVAYQTSVNAVAYPIGGIFAWPSKTDPVGDYLECKGQSVAKASYAALYAALKGSEAENPYGETTTHFTLPKLDDDRTIFGSSLANVATTGGANSVTLSESQMPAHTHSVSVANHGSLSHSTTVSESSDHSHTTQKHQHQGALIYRSYGDHNGFHVSSNADSNHSSSPTEVDSFHVDAIGINENSTSPFTSETDSIEDDGVTIFRNNSNPNTGSNGAHTHTVTVGSHSISAHSVTETSKGSNASVATQPKYLNMRWFIKY